MKRLTASPNLNAEIWVPEDGVDFRTAASLEPALQALYNLTTGYFNFIPKVRLGPAGSGTPFGNGSGLRIAASSQIVAWDNGSGSLGVWDLVLWNYYARTSPSGISHLLVDPYAHVLYAIVNGNLHRSADKGANWSQVLTSGYISTLLFSENTLLAVESGTRSYVWRSTNGGVTWTQIASTNPNIKRAEKIDNLWVGYASSGIYTSSDNGATWTNISTLTVPYDFTTYFSSPYVVKAGQKVWLPTNPISYHDGTQLIVTNLRMPSLTYASAVKIGERAFLLIIYNMGTAIPSGYIGYLIDLETNMGINVGHVGWAGYAALGPLSFSGALIV